MLAKNRQGAVLQGVQTLFDLGTVGALSDGELLRLYTGGRDAMAELAFTSVVERHGAMVLRVCRSILRDEHDAQDAFQATFLILVRRAAVIRKRESVGSWLHGVALRVSVCARTALARRRRHEQRAAEIALACSEDESESREIGAVLHDELTRLPERYRAAVVLCYLEGLSCEAAAQRLGWPVGTVKSRLSRGRERLFRRLIRRGFGPDESSSARSERASLLPAALAKPVEITLLPRSQHVEGSIRDTAGKPIKGVKIRVRQLMHEANGAAARVDAFLGATVTDETGRYTLSLPENSRSLLAPRHPRYFGPLFPCAASDRQIAAVTLEDAGGIAGTVIDSSTRKPVENARVGAQLIELGALRPFRSGLNQGGDWGDAHTDERGRFVIGGLGPGVFNVLLMDSGKETKYTARAVEGVRVKAGDDARADLVMIEGRRLHGIVTDFAAGKPMAEISVHSWNPARPRSGHSQLATTTDDAGNFELFVPPGSADVYCRGHYQHRTVFADREPDPIRFEKARGPTASYYEKYPESVEIQARIRVRTAMGDGTGRNERDLTGRVFDQHGLPIAAVQVAYNREKTVFGATDRMGVFRLKGLPRGPFSLSVNKAGYTPGWTTIPPEAHEVELTLESLPDVVE